MGVARESAPADMIEQVVLSLTIIVSAALQVIISLDHEL